MTVSGSGKTLLAVELVRMLLAARGLKQEDVTVVTGAAGTEELQGWIKGYGGLEGAKYSTERVTWRGGRDQLEPLLVSEGGKNKIVMADECWGDGGDDQDWSWLDSLAATADIIVCAKPSSYTYRVNDHPFSVTAPSGSHVLPFQLRTPHRQGWQPRQMTKYFTSHFKKGVLRSDMEESVGNLPPSLPLLWLELKEGDWRQEEVVEKVMDLLGEDKQKTGIWIQSGERTRGDVTGLPKSWRALDYDQVHGIEAEVTFFYCVV